MQPKLSNDEREMMRELHKADPKGWNISALAREYNVSRQYVQFIVYPERYERNYELRKKRRASAKRKKNTTVRKGE